MLLFFRRRISLFCALLSGGGALALEVVWTRMGVLIFGTTTASATAVLACFMGGLALGSYASTKFLAGVTRPLFLYGSLEALLALLSAGTALWSRSYHVVSDLPVPLAIAILLVATTLMGMTLPLLIQSLEKVGEGRMSSVSWPYAMNTLGGAAGALLSAFWLIPAFGLSGSALFASALICFAGFLAMASSWFGGSQKTSLQEREAESATVGRTKIAWIYGVAAWGGASALSLEVVWARLLSLILGPSVYALGIVFAVYLLGISFGAWLAAPISRRIEKPRGVAFTLLFLSVSVIWSLASIGILPYLFVELVSQVRPEALQLRWFELLLSAVAILPGALGHGLLLPFLIAQAPEKRSIADVSARVLAANTAGAIVGVSLTGLFLIPRVGFFPILSGILFLDAALGLWLLLRFSTILSGAMRKAIPALALILVGLFTFNASRLWDKAVLVSGVYKYAVGDALAGKQSKIQVGEIMYFKEGISSTVAVIRTGNDRVLSIDGKADASALGDQSTQVLLAALPLSLSERAEKVLVIGYASGVTAGVASLFLESEVTSIEIEPAVYEASAYFLDVNHGPLKGPKHRKIVADARHFLLRHSETYDVITSEPSNPWMSGVSPLFTKEFFSLAKSRLRKGGVMCQWLPIYGMSQPLVASVIRTFSNSFPNLLVFESVDGFDLLLIGGVEPLLLDPERMEMRWDSSPLREQLARIGIGSGVDLVGRFLIGPQGSEGFSRGAVINTDDNGYLEYKAPLTLHMKTAESNTQILVGASEGVHPYLSQAARRESIQKQLARQYLLRSREPLARQLHEMGAPR